MTVTMQELVGRWRKVEDSDTSASFPDEVEFFDDRTYRGTQRGRTRSNWDEASFDVLADGKVRIETANDRKVTYSTRLEGDELSFASENQRVTYRRAT